MFRRHQYEGISVFLPEFFRLDAMPIDLRDIIASFFQFNWVCDEAWKPNFSQSMYFAGAIIGTLMFGWILDHFGRFWTLMASNVNIMIMGIATPFASDFVSFTVIRFLTGFSYPTFFMCIYMLSRYILQELLNLVTLSNVKIMVQCG